MSGESLCYSVEIDGEPRQAIAPVTGMPTVHSVVVHNTCTPGLSAGDPIPSMSPCRFSSDDNGLTAGFNYNLNAGQMFYAYGYPKSSSSNVGYETVEKVSSYFVVDDAVSKAASSHAMCHRSPPPAAAACHVSQFLSKALN